MTVALCLPRADSYLWHHSSISDLDLSDEEFAPTSVFEPHATKKHKISDIPSFTLTELLAGPPAKRHKVEDYDLARLIVRDETPTPSIPATDLLHHACCNSSISLDEIKALIQRDPEAPARAVVITSEKTVYDFAAASRQNKQVKETYAYPLNLAIKHQASAEVIAFLIETSPSVLLQTDGQQQENSLMILLKHAPTNCTLIDKMLLQTPQCALASDRKHNTCLHIACRSQAPLVVIRHLAILFPSALAMTNFWQQTPLDIVQASSSLGTDDVSVYLWERQSHSQEYQ